jgi:hypothetical protein
MPLPRSHLESLQRQLHVHEEGLAVLRSHQKALEHQATKQARDPNPKVRSPEWSLVCEDREWPEHMFCLCLISCLVLYTDVNSYFLLYNCNGFFSEVCSHAACFLAVAA